MNELVQQLPAAFAIAVALMALRAIWRQVKQVL